ncbi:hypothetical protein H2199_004157 [Coniosporium tulheliwenetii]|uniref:Uncharacterized protein n=1 Tax=Coniosporium tulheliwenetii TaxID=3383036 RepID=A0ACC2Z765_9PEZI|nr:hypothetical protein H2199_004157 [Cladosporium sp. JES 115]
MTAYQDLSWDWRTVEIAGNIHNYDSFCFHDDPRIEGWAKITHSEGLVAIEEFFSESSSYEVQTPGQLQPDKAPEEESHNLFYESLSHISIRNEENSVESLLVVSQGLPASPASITEALEQSPPVAECTEEGSLPTDLGGYEGEPLIPSPQPTSRSSSVTDRPSESDKEASQVDQDTLMKDLTIDQYVPTETLAADASPASPDAKARIQDAYEGPLVTSSVQTPQLALPQEASGGTFGLGILNLSLPGQENGVQTPPPEAAQPASDVPDDSMIAPEAPQTSRRSVGDNDALTPCTTQRYLHGQYPMKVYKAAVECNDFGNLMDADEAGGGDTSNYQDVNEEPTDSLSLRSYEATKSLNNITDTSLFFPEQANAELIKGRNNHIEENENPKKLMQQEADPSQEELRLADALDYAEGMVWMYQGHQLSYPFQDPHQVRLLRPRPGFMEIRIPFKYVSPSSIRSHTPDGEIFYDADESFLSDAKMVAPASDLPVRKQADEKSGGRDDGVQLGIRVQKSASNRAGSLPVSSPLSDVPSSVGNMGIRTAITDATGSPSPAVGSNQPNTEKPLQATGARGRGSGRGRGRVTKPTAAAGGGRSQAGHGRGLDTATSTAGRRVPPVLPAVAVTPPSRARSGVLSPAQIDSGVSQRRGWETRRANAMRKKVQATVGGDGTPAALRKSGAEADSDISGAQSGAQTKPKGRSGKKVTATSKLAKANGKKSGADTEQDESIAEPAKKKQRRSARQSARLSEGPGLAEGTPGA